VRHYPTHIQRQLWLNPGAEFVVLHFQVLSGGDRLANLPQWLAFAGSISVSSLIAQSAGVSRRGQLFVAFAGPPSDIVYPLPLWRFLARHR